MRVARRKLSILVTGCNSGIGLELARHFDAEGHTVFAATREGEPDSVLGTCSERVLPVPFEMSNSASIDFLCERISKKLGNAPLDVLINNAGIMTVGPIEGVTRDELRRVFDINVFGTVGVTQAVLPLLRRSEDARLVNILSVASRVNAPFFGVYSMTKSSMLSFTKALRIELQASGIRVVNVEPSTVNTSGLAHLSEALAGAGKSLSPELASLYANDLECVARWYRENRNHLPVSSVVSAVAKAVSDKRPKATYWVGAAAHLSYFAQKIFGENTMANLVRKSMGMRIRATGTRRGA